jgi:hypothetical protein
MQSIKHDGAVMRLALLDEVSGICPKSTKPVFEALCV